MRTRPLAHTLACRVWCIGRSRRETVPPTQVAPLPKTLSNLQTITRQTFRHSVNMNGLKGCFCFSLTPWCCMRLVEEKTKTLGATGASFGYERKVLQAHVTRKKVIILTRSENELVVIRCCKLSTYGISSMHAYSVHDTFPATARAWIKNPVRWNNDAAGCWFCLGGLSPIAIRSCSFTSSSQLQKPQKHSCACFFNRHLAFELTPEPISA